VAKRWGCLL